MRGLKPADLYVGAQIRRLEPGEFLWRLLTPRLLSVTTCRFKALRGSYLSTQTPLQSV